MKLGRDYIIAINDVDPKVIKINHIPPITEDFRQNILREVQQCSCEIHTWYFDYKFNDVASRVRSWQNKNTHKTKWHYSREPGTR